MLMQEQLNDLTVRWESILEKGVVVADGDSWFDYPKPLGTALDILDQLEKLSYYIEDDAHWGDKLEDLATDERQHERFRDCLSSLHEQAKSPLAILLSAGGNDFTKDNLVSLLHPIDSGQQDPIDIAAMTSAFEEAASHYHTIIQRVTADANNILDVPSISIILHGYAYPVPDGRGYSPWLASRGKPGPWLQPAFTQQGYASVQENTTTMERILDTFNEFVTNVADCYSHVEYVDLRPCLSNGSDYKCYWRDELHPTDLGFRRIATRLDAAIQNLLQAS